MKKYFPTIFLIVILSGLSLLGARTAHADNGPLGSRITIDPATMTINEKQIGNATKLFDEQNTLQLDANGDPIQSSKPADCGEWWNFPVGGRACWMLNDTNGPGGMEDPASLVINLKQTYAISSIYVYYDSSGGSPTANTLKFNTGTPFNFTNLKTITYNSSSVPNGWVRIPAAQLQTQYIQMQNDTNFPFIHEVVIYGTPIGSAPAAPAPVTPIKSTVPFDKFVGVNVSFGMGQDQNGTNYDETWGSLRGYGGYQYAFTVNDTLVQPDGYTQAFLSRIKALGNVDQIDVEQGAALSMENPNNMPTGTDKIKAIDYTTCAGTTTFNGNLTCNGVADQPSSYAHKAFLDKELAVADAAEGETYLEPGNEPDGFWHDAGYYAPYELAAMMSTDYDGNCGTVTYKGQSVGVHNSGTSMKMAMPALADYNIDYLKAMEFWFQNHRTCAPTFPADAMNIHVYPTAAGLQFSGSAGLGLNPENPSFDMRDKVTAVVNFRNQYAPQATILNTEFGYDTYEPTPVDTSCTDAYGGSWQAAPQIGPYSVGDVQGQWLTRGMLEGEAEGLDGMDIFWLADQYPTTQLCGTFDASGMLTVDSNPKWQSFHAKPAWYDVQTLRNKLTGMVFVSENNYTSGNGTVRVQKYTSKADSTKSAYVVWSPTMTAWTTSDFALPLTTAATTSTIAITQGSVQGTVAASTTTPGSTVHLAVSELPTIVLANEGGTSTQTLTMSAASSQTTTGTTSTVTLTATPSSNSLVSSVTWKKISGPSTGTFSNINALTTTVSGLAAGTYVYEIDATPTSGAVVTAQTTVAVTVTSTPPPTLTMTATSAQTTTGTTSTVTLTGTPSNSALVSSSTWKEVSGPSTGTFANTHALTTTVSGLSAGSYVFEIDTIPTAGNNLATQTSITVTVTAPALTISAAASQTTTGTTSTVTLTGTPNNSSLVKSVAWRKISGPSTGTFSNAAALSTTVSGLAAGSYVFEIDATPNTGSVVTAQASVTVTVTQPALTMSASASQTTTGTTSTVTLTGTPSNSAQVSSVAWRKISGPSAGTFSNASALTTTVSGLTAGSYVFEIDATPTSGSLVTAQTSITVTVTAPALTMTAVSSQTVTGTTSTVTLSGTPSNSAQVSSVTWKKVSGPSTGTFSNINALTTTVSGLTAGSYVFEIDATPTTGSVVTAQTTITVTVATPTLTVTSSSSQTTTGTTSTVTLTGTPSNSSLVNTTTWKQISGPTTGTFTNTHALTTTVSGLTAGAYVFEFDALSTLGATVTSQTNITVTVTAPVLTMTATSSQTTTGTTSTVTLAAVPSSSGLVSSTTWKKVSGPSTGTFSNKNALTTTVSGLAAGTYVFEIDATPTSGAVVTAQTSITVTVSAAQTLTITPTVSQTVTDTTSTISLVATPNVGSLVKSMTWKEVSGPTTGVIAAPHALTTTVSGLTAGSYVFEIDATPTTGTMVTAQVPVAVTVATSTGGGGGGGGGSSSGGGGSTGTGGGSGTGTTTYDPGCYPGYYFSITDGARCTSANTAPTGSTGTGSTTYDIGCKPGYFFSITDGARCTSANTNPNQTGAPSIGGIIGNILNHVFNTYLARGYTGSEVSALQTTLINKGYLKGSADGVFGAATTAAVQSFQSHNGLTPDGFVGTMTRAALNK